MATTLDSMRENVIVFTQDEYNKLKEADYEMFGAATLKFYSKKKPYDKMHNISGDGSAIEWVLSGTSEIVTDWVEGFSIIKRVEYPAGVSGERRLPELERDSWLVLKTDTSTIKFRLLSVTPASSETVRITYTVPHILSSTQSTIYQEDEKAFEALWASLACKAIAANYAHLKDSFIDADVTDGQKLSAQFNVMSEQFKEVWNEHFPDPVVSLEKDLDIGFAWKTASGGGDFLTHPRKWR